MKNTQKGFVGTLLIVLVAVIVIAGAVFAYLVLTREGNLAQYYGDKAIAEKNLSLCLEIKNTNHYYPMDCWKYVASQDKEMSINLCRTVVGTEVDVDNCYTGFIDSRWNNYQQVLCEDLTNSKDKNYCYMVTALSSKNATFCDKISNLEYPAQITDCRKNVTQTN